MALRGLSRPCRIERVQDGQDAAGAPTQQMMPLAECLCHVSEPRGQRVTEAGEQVQILADAEVELPWDQDVQATDELVVTEESGVKTRYEVIGSNAGVTDRIRLVAKCVRADRAGQGVHL